MSEAVAVLLVRILALVERAAVEMRADACMVRLDA